MIADPHPQGLPGFRADLARKVAANEAVFVKDSAATAAALQRRGREAVAEFISSPEKVATLTLADRAALAEFMVKHAPEDTIRDLQARRIRAAFLHTEAVLRALFPPQAVFLLGLSPGLAVIAAAALGYYEPVSETIVRHCRFVAANGEFEFVRNIYAFNAPSPFLALAALPFIVFAGLRPIALNVLAMNLTMIVGVTMYGLVSAELANNVERAIAPYCSAADARTGAPIPLTTEQAERIRPISNPQGAPR